MSSLNLDPEVLAWWKRVGAVLDPQHALRPDEIERLYLDRPDTPSATIALELQRSPSPAAVKVLLYGARGAGKSTELSRLAHALRDSFVVVQVDLGAALPSRANTLAVAVLLGAAVLHQAEAWRAPDAELTELRSDVAKDAATLLGKALAPLELGAGYLATLVELTAPLAQHLSPGLGTPATAAGLRLISTTTGKLRQLLNRPALTEPVPPERKDDADAVVEGVNAALQTLAGLAGRTPLLLADGLDKRTDLDDIRLALADLDLLGALEAPLVLTGPVLLRHDPQFRRIEPSFAFHPLPNVAVRRRGPEGVETHPAGVGLLLDLYRKRVAQLPTPPAEDDALEQAAVMSSGIVREFLLLIWDAGGDALQAGSRTILREHMDAAVRRRRLHLQGYLNTERVQILERVLDKPSVLPSGERADELLFENLIACYANGDLWYRPHEAIAAGLEATLRHG